MTATSPAPPIPPTTQILPRWATTA
jgi:hypothetical protein